MARGTAGSELIAGCPTAICAILHFYAQVAHNAQILCSSRSTLSHLRERRCFFHDTAQEAQQRCLTRQHTSNVVKLLACLAQKGPPRLWAAQLNHPAPAE
eukprot:scaffold462_cov195-Pinguiococcus_pyrenoidosus.AAC.81